MFTFIGSFTLKPGASQELVWRPFRTTPINRFVPGNRLCCITPNAIPTTVSRYAIRSRSLQLQPQCFPHSNGKEQTNYLPIHPRHNPVRQPLHNRNLLSSSQPHRFQCHKVKPRQPLMVSERSHGPSPSLLTLEVRNMRIIQPRSLGNRIDLGNASNKILRLRRRLSSKSNPSGPS